MNEVTDVPWALLAPLLIIQVILLVVALVDLAKIEKTNGPKWMWAVICILFRMLGPIAYFLVGRKNN
jgi:nucleoside recognition membrane protein YjiH